MTNSRAKLYQKGLAELYKRETEKFTIGYSAPTVVRQEGEVWQDVFGKWWTIEDGVQVSVRRINHSTPYFCPKCSKSMGHRFDVKFYNIRNMCFSCVVEYEHELRLAGVYEEYERNTMLANEKDFLKHKIEEYDMWLNDPINFRPHVILDDGTVEYFEGADFSNVIAEVERDKQILLNRLKEIENGAAEREKHSGHPSPERVADDHQ